MKICKSLFFVVLLVSLPLSCERVTELEPEHEQPGKGDRSDELLDVYHVRDRDKPYPKMDNELFLNPPPFMVPVDDSHAGEKVQFCLSSDENFSDKTVILSEARPWSLFNPHKALDPGIWYWKYRYVDNAGTPKEWSETISFEVRHDTPVFVTPPFQQFFNNAPTSHPRLQCFTDGNIAAARATMHEKEGFAALKKSVDSCIKSLKNSNLQTLDLELVRRFFSYLYKAYYLTLDEEYRVWLDALFEEIISSRTDCKFHPSSFESSGIGLSLVEYYDTFYDEISAEVRAECERVMYEILKVYYDNKFTGAVNRLYDNHFWQLNYRVFIQLAMMLYDKPAYMEQVYPMIEFCYEIWTAKAPAWGVNRDGSWQNGIYYYTTNMETLYYVPMLFSHITDSDFLQHPWYRNAGKSLVYSLPPESDFAGGFGDGHERFTFPGKNRVAFADFLARETGDAYAGWYVAQNKELLDEDEMMVIYRLAGKDYTNTVLPENPDKMIWWKDAGEVAMHSNLTKMDENLTLTFRSSVFGSGSHTSASQNAFNIIYKGQPVFISSGYYDGFGTKHNLLSYRHTRAHNTILVNGIGQPFLTAGYGYITRAMGGDNISYCLGDASKAYCGITEDVTWTGAFDSYGITQTPEYGFGETPLNRYRRHIAMLHPDIIVIYDDLAADEPVRWDWLLHSNTEFNIDESRCGVSTVLQDYGIKAEVRMFCNDELHFSQTDQFVANPEKDNMVYPNQWHLTASVSGKSATRILSVFKLGREDTVLEVTRKGNLFSIGDWRIEACMDASLPSSLKISNVSKPCVLDYGSENPIFAKEEYVRKFLQSTSLYDEKNGKYEIEEQGDRLPIATRAN